MKIYRFMVYEGKSKLEILRLANGTSIMCRENKSNIQSV